MALCNALSRLTPVSGAGGPLSRLTYWRLPKFSLPQRRRASAHGAVVRFGSCKLALWRLSGGVAGLGFALGEPCRVSFGADQPAGRHVVPGRPLALLPQLVEQPTADASAAAPLVD